MDKSDWRLAGYLVFNHAFAVLMGVMVFTALAAFFDLGMSAFIVSLIVCRMWPDD